MGGIDVPEASDAFRTLATLASKWAAEQQKSDAVFAALLEFHGRLMLLEPQRATAAATRKTLGQEGMLLLQAKHVRSLENLLCALQISVTKFEALHSDVSEVYAEICHRHSSGSSPVDGSHEQQQRWGVLGAGRGLDAQSVGLPPPDTCIAWVRECDQQFAAELLLKLEILDRLDLGRTSEELHGLHRLWTLQPNLAPATLERTRALAESLRPPPPTM